MSYSGGLDLQVWKGQPEPREMSKNFDFKSTLNLPKTDFPMKAKLPEREPEQLAAWEEMGLYKQNSRFARGCAPLRVT